MNPLDTNYPEEYTNGSVHFFGREYQVTPDVLIPRLETECLIRRARKILQSQDQFGQEEFSIVFSDPKSKNQKPKTIIIDIGSGSGIIGTSVADLADEVIFLDISREALQVTEKNFRTHYPTKKAEFIESDLLSGFIQKLSNYPNANLLFLTNLPYIKDEDWKNMSPDTQFEPKLALFGGEKTGFELYERLFEELHSIHRCDYNSIQLLFEFGFDQREIAEKVLQKYGNWKYSFFADYAGIERFGEIVL